MKKRYNLTQYGKTDKIELTITSYQDNKSLAITMDVVYPNGTREPWDVLTTNLEESLVSSTNKAYVKKDSYEEFIKENDLGYPTGVQATSGFNTYLEFDFTNLINKK